MRSFGFVLVILGAVIAYLGWNRKLGAAWTALLTGQVPDMTGGSNPQYSHGTYDSAGLNYGAPPQQTGPWYISKDPKTGAITAYK
jgi:hypothetical protein